MSKSRRQSRRPSGVGGRCGVDAIRYFLMREAPLGSDLMLSNELLLRGSTPIRRTILETASFRTVAMIGKIFWREVPRVVKRTEDQDRPAIAEALPSKIDALVSEWKVSEALAEIRQYIGMLNKYIDITMPWALRRTKRKGAPRSVMYHYGEGLRIVSVL